MFNLFKSLILQAFCFSAVYAQSAATSDLVVNEILFNPSKDGYDYVEIYNRSQKTIDLQKIVIAMRNATNDPSGLKQLARNPLPLGPSRFCVITPNEKWLRQNYFVVQDVIICELSSLPSFPDDEGTVILLNKADSVIIDEVNYNKDWHFPLIDDLSGVALERISYDLPSQDNNNWTSASSSSGYGSPGSVNSQFLKDFKREGSISVTPKIFSPDNDGLDDFASVFLNMNEQGYAANAMVYDISGRRVRYLIKNKILGTSDQFKWDGFDDNLKRSPPGLYILVTQVFNLKGETRKFKNVIIMNYRNN